MNWKKKADTLLSSLYPEGSRREILLCMEKLIKEGKNKEKRTRRFTSEDCWLIAYADSLKDPGRPPLEVFREAASSFFRPLFSLAHLLPFFPYSSDDGFAVIDYEKVDPQLGTWGHIQEISRELGLMGDLVLNHVSAQSPWVKEYLAGNPEYDDFFIEMDPQADLSAVTRPRALPLLTPFLKKDGTKVWLWTTFSADQVDLNYANPRVLIKMLEIIALYMDRGIEALRLDAVGFLWKKPGTPSIHLDETHQIIKLFRLFTKARAPGFLLVTETNVPHKENISYFGNGRDEAQVIYNFSLPPLTFYAFLYQNASKLRHWARTLKTPTRQCAFLNFTASHDGIGVRPLEGYISKEELDAVVAKTEEAGGAVSFRDDPQKRPCPYELNITFLNAVTAGLKNEELRVKAFLASQALMLFLPGIPAVYVNSLFGIENWKEGVKAKGTARAINRYKSSFEEVRKIIAGEEGFQSQIFSGYARLLRFRRNVKAFSPHAPAVYPDTGESVFTVIRGKGKARRYCFINITDKPQRLSLSSLVSRKYRHELFPGTNVHHPDTLLLDPFDVRVLGAERGDISVDSSGRER